MIHLDPFNKPTLTFGIIKSILLMLKSENKERHQSDSLRCVDPDDV